MFAAVEGQDGEAIVESRFDVHGTPPKPVQVLQRVAGVVDLEFGAAEDMFEEQLAAILVVAVADANDRAAAIGQAEQQLLLDLLELAAFDFVVARIARCSRRRTCLCDGRSRASGTRR